MRAASRQAYATAEERLDGFAAGATAEQCAQVAEELLAAAGLLADEVRLRRALSDPARSADDRVGLSRELFGDRTGQPAGELLDTLVAGRWSAASELLEGMERLGVQALLAGAERAGVLAEVEDELFRFGQIVTGDPGLVAVLGDSTVPVARRATLIDGLLADRATATTVRLATVALRGFGGRGFAASVTRLVEFAARRRDRHVAYVTVASPLTEELERRLGAALSARYGREVSVKTTVDPKVLGGMRVRVGADLYDGTVASRLAQARTALAPG